jgi:prepilin-type N-terminal cleavage/methylation domain-containing protein
LKKLILFNRKKKAFTLVELMIALLLVSSLGLGISLYMQRSSQTLRTSEQASDIERNSMITSRILSEDIRQVAYLNPSCAENPANGESVTPCAQVPVRGGLIPLPGLNQAAVDALPNMNNPPTLTADPLTLGSVNDGLRMVIFDFATDFDCSLLQTLNDNPEAASERFFVPDTCQPQLEVGGLYVMVQQQGVQSFSNLFQITALNLAGAQLEVQHASLGSIYNQVGSLRSSGFTNTARIYPVHLVEYALDEALATGLYRREIRPDAGDLAGYQEWVAVDPLVESLQFQSVTIEVAGDTIFHNRVMNFSADVGNDGLEDIRGVRPRLILRSERAAEGEQLFSNPMIPAALEDEFPRKDVMFFVAVQNFQF